MEVAAEVHGPEQARQRQVSAARPCGAGLREAVGIGEDDVSPPYRLGSLVVGDGAEEADARPGNPKLAGGRAGRYELGSAVSGVGVSQAALPSVEEEGQEGAEEAGAPPELEVHPLVEPREEAGRG